MADVIKYHPQSKILKRCDFCNKATSNYFYVNEGLAQGKYDKDSCYQSALSDMKKAQGNPDVPFDSYVPKKEEQEEESK